MKKLIATLLILMVSPISALAGVTKSVNNTDKVALLKKAAPIEDEFVKSNAFPKVIPSYVNTAEPIVDELVVPYEKDGITLRIWARKNGVKQDVSIDDELITPKFVSKTSGISILKKYSRNKIEDNFVKNNIDSDNVAKIKVKTNYDFSKAQIPVQMKVIKNLTTKNNIVEGDSILFKTVNEVNINGTILPKGTQVIGRVETVSASDKMGCPANIVVDNFYVKDNPDICFYGNVSKTGANRSIWVYPLYQAGNILLYAAGFVFVPIHGGHAKILTSDTFTVFYETGATN